MLRSPGYGRRGADGKDGKDGLNGTNGTNGSNASATPLSNAAPKALGASAATGSSTAASRDDHVHPLPSGRLEFLGNINATETLILSLGLGMKRKDFPITLAQGVAAVAVGDKLQLAPNGNPTAGCEAVNAYPSTTSPGQVSIGYYTPALGIAATYNIPVSIYRIT